MTTRLPYSFSKLLGVYIAWWTFWLIAHLFVLHRLQLSWQVSLIDSLLSNTLLAAVSLVVITIYRFYQPGKRNRIYLFIIAIGITKFFSIVLHYILAYVFKDDASYLIFLEKSLPIRFIFSLLIISFITIVSWLLNNLSEQKENEKRKSDSEQLMKEAELTKLRQQLQPHFLFNSLNSISALIGTKPADARKMIQQLSDFLRGTLKKEDQLIKLSEELEHLKLYLEIEKVRFGHRLHVQFNLSDDSLEYKLPSLLLQPIVENAIKFGLYGTTEHVEITISTFVQTGYLHIEIKNPFDINTKKSVEGVGFGLKSIQRRLYLLYARNDLLLTESRDLVFSTTLKIPASV